MPTLVIPANVVQCHVEDFPDGCERSREGSVHVRPASTLTVTDDELAHLKKAHPQLFRQLIVAKKAPSLADKLKPRAGRDAALKKALDEKEAKGKARREAAKKAADAALSDADRERMKQEQALKEHQKKKAAAKVAKAKAGEGKAEAPKKPAPKPLPKVEPKKPKKVN
jgi:hypothetical protein